MTNNKFDPAMAATLGWVVRRLLLMAGPTIASIGGLDAAGLDSWIANTSMIVVGLLSTLAGWYWSWKRKPKGTSNGA